MYPRQGTVYGLPLKRQNPIHTTNNDKLLEQKKINLKL